MSLNDDTAEVTYTYSDTATVEDLKALLTAIGVLPPWYGETKKRLTTQEKATRAGIKAYAKAKDLRNKMWDTKTIGVFRDRLFDAGDDWALSGSDLTQLELMIQESFPGTRRITNGEFWDFTVPGAAQLFGP